MNRDATRINTVGLLAGGSSVDTGVAAGPCALGRFRLLWFEELLGQ